MAQSNNQKSEQERHRSGVFKQQNKTHKTGRHRSKGSISIANKGRIEKCSVKKASREMSREARRNQAKQLRQNKREEYMKLVRSQNDPPLVVALVALHDKINYFTVLDKLKSCDAVESKWFAGNGYNVISVPRFRRRFMFIPADINRIYHTMNVIRVADAVLFLTSVADTDVDIDHLMSCILGQGIPSNPTVAIVDLHEVAKKKQQEMRETIQQSVESYLPSVKVSTLESMNDIVSYFRVLSTQKTNNSVQRDKRAYVLTENIEFEQDEGNSGSLVLSGYVRAQTLSPNDLVHVTGWKDFRIKKIHLLSDPYMNATRNVDAKNVMKILTPEVGKQETLDSENIPDPMDAEQTWPTEEELAEADNRMRKRLVKKVPEGFSDYQAAWIPDCDAEYLSDVSDLEEENESDMSNSSDSDNMSVDEGDGKSCVSFAPESTVSEYPAEPNKYDERVDVEEERRMFEKIKEARSDKMFPDEIDTPVDTPARVRFQKYRGLKSFRTSPWDPKENLPADYARIFQFENFKRTEKRVRQDLNEKIGVAAGLYVKVYLEGVTEEEFKTIDCSLPMLATAMLPHEQKMSVISMLLKRPNLLDSDEPIKSKEELIIQCGYRRFKCCPIFSQLGSGTVHKYLRFFQPDETVVATVYAPIQFPPCSVLAFKEHEDSSVGLVATGRLLSVDPDRIVVKRTVLSGHPFKVHRKSAVIRFMFYNPDDVEWFKPVELHTKYGRRGHIREPLGTHGHMKCVFDKPLKSQDTVLLNLYKRVYPKWTYSNLNTALYTCN